MLICKETVDTLKKFKCEIKNPKSPLRKQLEQDYRERKTSDLLNLYFHIATGQSYGPLMEKFYIKENNYIKVPSKDDRGDYKKTNNEYEEYKFTFPNDENGYKLNFVQIRPWQEITGYLFEVYSPRDGWYRFRIPKKDMKSILFDHGALAHGTIETNKNEKKELALRGKIGDDLWKKLQKYKEN
jgi:hypothetical protein